MILSTHFIAGAAVASQTNNPAILVILPLTIHFVLDFIPHWEYVEEAAELKHKIPQLILDLLSGPLAILLVSYYVYGLDFGTIIWLFIGGFMGVLPDGFSFLYFCYPRNRFLKKLFSFHESIHHKKLLDWKIGFPAQVVLDIIAVIIIALPKM